MTRATRTARTVRTEPAHNLLYDLAALPPPAVVPDTEGLYARVEPYLKDPFNDRQKEAFRNSFTERASLLWGPPGTGKTIVLAGIILGWLETAALHSVPVCIGIGANNYNAIDNVLGEVADLLDRRRASGGPPPTRIFRVRSSARKPSDDGRFVDVARGEASGASLLTALGAPSESLIVGGTWMQLGRMGESASADGRPIARWFDLLVIDEASQVPVSSAAGYFLLMKEEGNVVLAGDHKQLGPIYGFKLRDDEEGLFDCIFTYMQGTPGSRRAALSMNYRTNEEISGWPRERFYIEGYEAFNPTRRLDVSLAGFSASPPAGWPATLPWKEELLRILDPDLPVAVISYEAQGYTLSNPFEAQMVAALANLYRLAIDPGGGTLDMREFWKRKIGIVTPHRAQMANIRNLLVEGAGMPPDAPVFVDTVDRFQGQERDIIIASYTVADRDFVASEEAFILEARRFNVTQTRARSKFILFVSNSVLQHLPADLQVARDAAHLQLFVENYCSSLDEKIELIFSDRSGSKNMPCRLRGRR